MSDKLKLAAEARNEFGKGAARRARAAHKIPAVLYGHGENPTHLLLPGHDTMMALKHANALLTIEWDKHSELAIAKDVQRDPVKRTIDHVDLLLVKKGEKITVDVPVHLVGEPFSGMIAMQDLTSLSVSADATELPEVIEVSIEGLEEGARITAGEVTLPKGADLVTDPSYSVVTITAPRTQEEADEELGETDEAPAAEAADEAPAEAEGDSE